VIYTFAFLIILKDYSLPRTLNFSRTYQEQLLIALQYSRQYWTDFSILIARRFIF